jgi:hypothetical protein
MYIAEKWLALAATCFVALCLILFWTAVAGAHDPEHSELDEWYHSLMQPDQPIPCCGKNDSWFCDDYHMKTGPDGVKNLYCTIDDDRDIPGRVPVPNGTEVFIPPHKYNKDPNPTGHSILFGSPIRSYGDDGEKIVGFNVYCFVMGGGV